MASMVLSNNVKHSTSAQGMNDVESQLHQSLSISDSGLNTPAFGKWHTASVDTSVSPFPLETIKVQPVGRWFEQHAIHKLTQIDSKFHDMHAEALSRSSSTAVSNVTTPNESESEEETPDLLAANFNKWRHQDHYAILGIARKRWRATEDDLRRAYRRKVLRHHPDKMKQAAESSQADASTKKMFREESSFFKCVQGAYDLLLDSVKRRQFDSVDPTFDDSIPDEKIVLRDEDHFYETFGPVFQRNVHFLRQFPKQPWMADLGHSTTSDEHVERFYSAWFHFDSWRSFEYWDFLDEKDNPEKADSRDERRYLERKFKARHDKSKKDDNARLVRLVELAYKLDPRMKRIRQRAKQGKEDEKLRREQEKLKSMECELRAKEQAEREKQEQLEQQKRSEEEQKKQKEALKKEKQKLKKTFRQLLKCCDYFANLETLDGNSNAAESATLSQRERERRAEATLVRYETWLDKIADKWTLPEFKEHVDHALRVYAGLPETDDDEQSTLSVNLKEDKAADEVRRRIKTYIDACILSEEQHEARAAQQKKATVQPLSTANTVAAAWTEAEIEALILAVKSLPAGVRDRWQRIAEYTSQHGGHAPLRSTEEVIAKAKTLLFGKEELAKKDPLFEAHQKKGSVRAAEDQPTVREADWQETSSVESWTAEQQALLEQGLKTYAATDAERWEHISALVNGKSKKECMARYKHLAELVKAKKEKREGMNE